MNDFATPVIPTVPVGAGLTQMERVTNVFVAPSKTFNDIKRNTSWWLPFVITAVFGYALFAGIQMKVGWTQVYENTLKASPKQAERFEKMPADQRASAVKFSGLFTEGFYAAMPILAIIGTAAMAGIQLATINFGFGGKATFWQVFAVSWYGSLPGLLRFLLGTVALFVGLDPESFNINNFAGTNIGYYMPLDMSKGLLTLLTFIDITSIWCMIISAIGLSIVAGTKRSAAYITIFGWWAVWVLLWTGVAAAFS